MKNKIITKTVVLLSVVSFFGDISSELLYPIMPMYLKSIGMGAVYIGVLEGIADFIAGISKTYFGKLSDLSGRRLPFVWGGYLLSSFSKFAIGLFLNPLWILFARTSDRLGKGVRTAARDAMLSNEATPETKGAVFGFHRALDTFGAFLGPILALVYLHYHPGDYRNLFYFVLIPAIFMLITLFFVHEKEVQKKQEEGNPLINSLVYWKIASHDYKKIVSMILMFTLLNSSDMFLLLKLKEDGMSDFSTILFYIFYNFVYAVSSYEIGKLSDKLGKKKIFISGLFFFFLTYLGMAINQNYYFYFLIFIFYGLFAACTEGVTKAWISNLCKKEDLATAIGFQSTTQSVASMLASFIAGIIWYNLGANYTFYFSSIGAFILIFFFAKENKIN